MPVLSAPMISPSHQTSVCTFGENLHGNFNLWIPVKPGSRSSSCKQPSCFRITHLVVRICDIRYL